MTKYIKVLSLPILLSFSLDAFAKSWLNESEHITYEDIVAEHDEVFINSDLQNLLSLNVEKNNTYKSNLKKMAYINSQLDRYIQDAKYSEDINEYKLSNNIAKLIVNRSELSISNKIIIEEIEDTSDKIASLKVERDIKNRSRISSLSSLSKNIINRIRNEWNGKKKTIVQEGNFSCNEDQSIKNCLSRNRSLIVAKFRSDNEFISPSQDIDNYKIENASVDFSGNLSYRVSVEVSPVLTDEIISQIHSYLGINEVNILLTSNVNASWYLNGEIIGSGKKISKLVTSGKHTILASYDGKVESTVEQVVDGKEYYYNFKKSKKSKKTNNHESTTKIERKTVVKKTTPDSNEKIGKEQGRESNNTIKSIMLSDPTGLDMSQEDNSLIVKAKGKYGKELITKIDDFRYFIIGSIAEPLIGDVSAVACEDFGRPADLIEYLNILEGDTLESVKSTLSKHTIYTNDFGIVKVTDGNFENSTNTSAVTVCVTK
ncbi:hypothetical protein VFDL14_07220 [Vibrio fortis]|uniref:Uncharacterized protein n=1 Tax=Vibrio fortis TaxID=212667 RepID=A0A066UT88_9VIBR|nr:hypothetical protein [Vibrio fortis]KDN30641.1 hypothetical protein VFDL14_07220 [Vibrio fortis]